MPHLSPMNWLLAMIMFWMTLNLIQSGTWWDLTTSFSKPKINIKLPNTNNWHWLQDGRV